MKENKATKMSKQLGKEFDRAGEAAAEKLMIDCCVKTLIFDKTKMIRMQKHASGVLIRRVASSKP